LVRFLAQSNHDAVSIDIKKSPYTQHVGSIAERSVVREHVQRVDVVLHTATLHKPHIATHTRQDFVDTNITGTLILLEEAAAAGVKSFIYTSTTSTFGRALRPPEGAPAAWITEDVTCLPKNIYGATKLSAEHLCEVFQWRSGLPCIVLRTSRFFPEEDDDKSARQAFNEDNLKINEFLYRRVDIEDVVSAHMLAIEKATDIGFGRYIISATSPFSRDDLRELRTDAASVVRRYVPGYEREYAKRGWSMVSSIDRVYVNERARTQLGWQPRYNFAYVIDRLRASEDYRSPLARAVGSKGYHAEAFAEGPYPTE
jgi:UDP-glucose 4-epimerase